MDYHTNLSIDDIVKYALFEDCSLRGDITSEAIFNERQPVSAVIESKDSGVLSGAYLLEPIFKAVDSSITVDCTAQDGSLLLPGARICSLHGAVRSIFTGERVALNFLQRLSGIATATARLVRMIAHTQARLLDTRKTTPLLRDLEKRAVRDGGGKNHRFGLFDMILIKDTHVKAAGSVTKALTAARAFVDNLNINNRVKIEVEVQSREEFVEALQSMPDRMMLDNMGCDVMTECVAAGRRTAPSIEYEASGNITEETIVAVAETGVDFISVGAITHSVKAVDIHLVVV